MTYTGCADEEFYCPCINSSCDEICACGCGMNAREGSQYHSIKCRKRKNRMDRAELFKNIIPEDEYVVHHVAQDTIPWEERCKNIVAKYGVHKK